MVQAMQLALEDAGVSPDAIGYVNAHGTATERGDIAESQATREVFGRRVAISSLKSYFGHTLGACGALESWLPIEMMREGWFAPTINLDNLDPACADLDYLTGDGRAHGDGIHDEQQLRFRRHKHQSDIQTLEGMTRIRPNPAACCRR